MWNAAKVLDIFMYVYISVLFKLGTKTFFDESYEALIRTKVPLTSPPLSGTPGGFIGRQRGGGKTTVQFDIDKFLEIVANLTFDYYTNLTAQVNETLQKMSIKPTCPAVTTPRPVIDYKVDESSLRGKVS